MTTFTKRCLFLLALTFCLGWNVQAKTTLPPSGGVERGIFSVLLTEKNQETSTNFFDGTFDFIAPVEAGCNELFISEYIEGSGSGNKCIEVYNPTPATVDLSAGAYGVALYTNGSSSVSQSAALTGSIASGGTYVICNSGASFAYDQAANNVMNFNGNDAVALTVDGVNIDVIGQIGVNPGTEWGAGLTSTADNTIRRNANITMGDPDGSNAFDPATEWTGYAQNNADDLGSHTSDGCGDVTPVMEPCSELFISEYIEGSGVNKCIEVYNPTPATVDLGAGAYGVSLYTNGASSPSQTAALTGSVASGASYVICNSGATFSYDQAANNVMNFNGDDAVSLTKDGVNIDVIGQIGLDPGTEWGAGLTSTADNTIRRNPNITMGDPDGSNAFDPATEWTGYAQDNADDLGSHTSECIEEPVGDPCSELFISEYIEGSSFNKCIEIYNPTPSTIDLAAGGYGAALYSNGASSPNETVALTGSIISGGTYVLCHADAEFTYDQASSAVMNFNGDDAVALTKDAVNIDVIGQIGFDPGSQWGGGDASTQDNTIRRNPNVTMGDPDGSDAFDPAAEWTGYAQNDAENLGRHLSECVEAPACMITGLTLTNVAGCNNGETPGTIDDFFAFDIVVTYENAPTTGNLVISGDLYNGNDIVVPVADLTGSPFVITGQYNPNFTYAYSGISDADGLPLPLSASFTAEPLCIFTTPDAGPALPPCSVADPCTELFFSEYIEGSGNNKCLEIYNPAQVDVDMGAAGYQIVIYFNGSTTPGSVIPLTGTISAGGVYVVCDDASMPQFLAAADEVSTVSFFNGDDAVALVNSGGYTDVIGQIGFDPGSAYTGGGVSTQNQTLVRPFGITGGDKNGFDSFDPSTAWIGLPQDNASDLGIHVSECNPYPPGCDPYTIGDCGGETDYDFGTGIFTLTTNCFSGTFLQDAQQTVLKDMCGDGEVIARVLTTSSPDWAGIQIRESLAPGSKMVALKTSFSNFIQRDVRASTNGFKLSQQFFRPAVYWFKLIRSGSQFVGYASPNGVNWQLVMFVNVQMDACVYAGIFVESTTPNDAAIATFDNVNVTSSYQPLGLSVETDLAEAMRKGDNPVYPFGVELPGNETSSNTVAVDLNVYPNPAKDELNVLLPQLDATNGEVSILDLNGKVLYHQPYALDGQQISLDLNALQLSAGMYQVVLHTDNEVITKRFVKAN